MYVLIINFFFIELSDDSDSEQTGRAESTFSQLLLRRWQQLSGYNQNYIPTHKQRLLIYTLYRGNLHSSVLSGVSAICSFYVSKLQVFTL